MATSLPFAVGMTAAVQPDFFSCDIFDALPKDDLASMEHPLFSLATRPDRSILNYQHNGVEIEVTAAMPATAAPDAIFS